jgi:hypothetical protein
MSEVTLNQKAELMILSGMLSGVNAENYVDKLLEFSRKIWETRTFGDGIVDGKSQTLRIGELEIRWNPNNGSKLIQPHNIGIITECHRKSDGCNVRIPYFGSRYRHYSIPQRFIKDGKWYTYVPLSMLMLWREDERGKRENPDEKVLKNAVQLMQNRIDAMIRGEIDCVYHWL